LNFSCFDRTNEDESKNLNIQLSRKKIIVTTSSDEYIKGIRLIVQELISNTISKPKWLFRFVDKSTIWLIVLPMLYMMFIQVLPLFNYQYLKDKNLAIYDTTGLIVSPLVIWSFAFIYFFFKKNSINLISRNPEEGFLTRNKDKIIIAIFAAIAGAVFGAAATVILLKLIMGQ
jgi:hypothetical protein